MEESLTNLLVIIAAIVLAPLIANAIPRIKVPVVVIEIALGIVIGPQVLGLAQKDAFVEGLAQLGLAFLFFLAGFEIDFARIKGRPLKLAGSGWLLSIIISIACATVLYASRCHSVGALRGDCLDHDGDRHVDADAARCQ